MLSQVLQDNGFTAKEAKIYLATLELNNAPASSIARRASENRVTAYTILKDLGKRGIVNEITKNKVKYYTALEPEQLLNLQKQRIKKLETSLPELLAMGNKGGNKPKVYFYDGLEGIKYAFEEALRTKPSNPKETFLVFMGGGDVDPGFSKYVEEEFIYLREKCPIKSKMLISKSSKKFTNFNKNLKDTVFIEDSILDEWNEVILFDTSKIGFFMYNSKDMSALIIDSKTLHNGLKGIFNFIRNAHTSKKR